MNDHSTKDLLSQREAASLLTHLARPQAQFALACGLAGPASPWGRRLLYPRHAVEALAARPGFDPAELHQAGAPGIVSARVPRSADSATVADRARLLAWASGPWKPTLPLRVLLEVLAEGRLPLLVTASSYVVAAFEIDALSITPQGMELALGPPGDWSALAEGRIWDLGSGGRTFRYLDLGPHRRWWA